MKNYQILELIFGFLLFLPLFYLYYKLQNKSISIYNVLITGIFLTIIIFIKNIVVNYYEMVFILENSEYMNKKI
jgi:hypothetical protein